MEGGAVMKQGKGRGRIEGLMVPEGIGRGRGVLGWWLEREVGSIEIGMMKSGRREEGGEAKLINGCENYMTYEL